MSQQPCQFCSAPSSSPTCTRCEAEHNRISSLQVSGRHHEKRVTEARQWLTELPDLYCLLPAFTLPGSAPKDPDQRSGKANPAWRSVVNLDVLDLMDTREKSGADPTRGDFDVDSALGARRQGVVNTLASWSRLVSSELADEGVETELAEEPTIVSECTFLLTHLDWIAEHRWFDDELYREIKQLRTDVRRAIGESDRKVPKFVCPQCSAESVLVTGGFLACTMTEHHDVSVRDLAGQYRRRVAITTDEVCSEFNLAKDRLWQWKSRGKVKPINPDDRHHRWLPWDVFSQLNPDLRKAIDMLDAADDAVA